MLPTVIVFTIERQRAALRLLFPNRAKSSLTLVQTVATTFVHGSRRNIVVAI
jgi:hypothetical protein